MDLQLHKEVLVDTRMGFAKTVLDYDMWLRLEEWLNACACQHRGKRLPGSKEALPEKGWGYRGVAGGLLTRRQHQVIDSIRKV